MKLYFDEPDECEGCGSTDSMPEEDVSVDGHDGLRAWLCPVCGHTHLHHPGKCCVVSCDHQAGGPPYIDDQERHYCPCHFSSPRHPGGNSGACAGPMPDAGAKGRFSTDRCPACGGAIDLLTGGCSDRDCSNYRGWRP